MYRFFVYMLVGGCTAGLPLMLSPYLTSQLSMAEYGKYGVFLILVSIFSCCTGLSSQSYLVKVYNDIEVNLKHVFSNSLIIVIGSYIFIYCILIAFASFLDIDLFLAALNVGSLAFLYRYFMTYCQLSKETNKYLISFVVFLSSLLFCFLVGIDGLWDITSAYFISYSIVIFIVALYLTLNHGIYISISTKRIKAIVTFSFPLLIDAVVSLLISGSDRILIAKFFTSEDVAIFTLSTQLSFILFLYSDSFNKWWVPEFMELKESRNGRNKIIKLTKIYMLSLPVVSFIIYIIIYNLFDKFYGPEYSDVLVILPISLLIQCTVSYIRVFNIFLFVKSRTALIALLNLMALTANVIIFFITYELIGYYSAVVSSLISFVMVLVCTIYYSRKDLLKFIGGSDLV